MIIKTCSTKRKILKCSAVSLFRFFEVRVILFFFFKIFSQKQSITYVKLYFKENVICERKFYKFRKITKSKFNG